MQCPDNVSHTDGFAPCVLHDSAHIRQNLLEKGTELQASLIVNGPGDTLDAAAASQTANVRLSDALNVVAKNPSSHHVSRVSWRRERG